MCFDQWERPPEKACMANSSAVLLTFIPDPITASRLAANFAARYAALQHSLLKVSLQPRLALPKCYFSNGPECSCKPQRAAMRKVVTCKTTTGWDGRHTKFPASTAPGSAGSTQVSIMLGSKSS